MVFSPMGYVFFNLSYTGGNDDRQKTERGLFMDSSAHLAALEKDALRNSLQENLDHMRIIEQDSSDLMINPVTVGGISCALICCEGMLSTSTITDLILYPMTTLPAQFTEGSALLEYLQTYRLLSTDRIRVTDFATLFRTVNSGFAVLLAEGADFAYAFGVQGYDRRGVSEPSSEINLYGAKDAFTEIVRSNMSLIRRRMKSPLLTQKLIVCGSVSRTDLCICYLRDRVPKELVAEIQTRLEQIPVETVLAAGYLRPYLEQKRPSLFHSTGISERPDVVCAKLLEGRVAVLIDGVPYALVIPQLFWEVFQTVDDYNCKPVYATLIRWLKYLAFLLAVLLPGVYLAVATWHPYLLHATLLQLLAQSEHSAPFSPAAELVGVLLVYEIIREAGLRLPKAVSGAVSIVGGLIIGDAAVSSGLISTPLLTIAAISVTAGFVTPELHQQITILRLMFVAAGGLLGLNGIGILICMTLYQLCATETFGFPITAPVVPFSGRWLRDVLYRQAFRRMAKGNFTVEEVRQQHHAQ